MNPSKKESYSKGVYSRGEFIRSDGFDSKQSDPSKLVVLIAATNRPEILDAALVRPGRLDRTVIVPLPDLAGRAEILKLHATRVTMDPSVDLGKSAKYCVGFSGAELANIVNEAALLAVRDGKSAVDQNHVDLAIKKCHAARAHLGISHVGRR